MCARKIVFTNVPDFNGGRLAVFHGLSVPCIVIPFEVCIERRQRCKSTLKARCKVSVNASPPGFLADECDRLLFCFVGKALETMGMCA